MIPYPPYHPKYRATPPIAFSAKEFEDAFPGESELIEFKTGVGAKPFQETVVSFSNTEGGVIVVGVKDDGTVVGRENDAGTRDAIHQAISHVQNPGRYTLNRLAVDDRPVVVVAVERRHEGFAQTSQGVVNVRKGTRDEALFGDDLQRFINERSHRRFESTPSGLAVSSAAPDQLSRIKNAFGWSDNEVEMRLQEVGLAQDGELTIAGVLHLTEDPERVLGKPYIEILRYRLDDSIDYDKRIQVTGSLAQQLANATSAVHDELGSQMVVLGLNRYELPPIPEVVLREAIANAIAHRSYEIDRTPVRIEIRPSEVKVVSPGGLPEPVTVENIRETQSARNLTTIRVLRQLGVAEDAGRGVDVMQDTMSEQMLDQPNFVDHAHSFEVSLSTKSAVTSEERAWILELEKRGTLTGDDRLILVMASRGETLTNSSVREKLRIDSNEARESLQRLRDAGFLEQKGSRRGAAYVLNGSLRAPAGLRLSGDELDSVVVEMAKQAPLTNRALRDATGVDRNQARTVLSRLVKNGRIEQHGSRKGTTYSAPEDE